MSSVHDSPPQRQGGGQRRQRSPAVFHGLVYEKPGRASRQQQEDLRDELRFPPGALFCSVDVDLGTLDPTLKGWVYEVHGGQVQIRDGRIVEPPPGHPPTVFHYCVYMNADGDQGTVIGWPAEGLPAFYEAQRVAECNRVLMRPWSTRVYPPNSVLYAEEWWDPVRGWDRRIGGAKHPHSPEDAARADRGFAVIDQYSLPVGRPRDSEKDTLDEMAGWLLEYLRRHPSVAASDVGRSELQAISGMSMGGLNNRMATKHVTLKKIRERAAQFAREDPKWADLSSSLQ